MLGAHKGQCHSRSCQIPSNGLDLNETLRFLDRLECRIIVVFVYWRILPVSVLSECSDVTSFWDPLFPADLAWNRQFHLSYDFRLAAFLIISLFWKKSTFDKKQRYMELSCNTIMVKEIIMTVRYMFTFLCQAWILLLQVNIFEHITPYTNAILRLNIHWNFVSPAFYLYWLCSTGLFWESMTSLYLYCF